MCKCDEEAAGDAGARRRRDRWLRTVAVAVTGGALPHSASTSRSTWTTAFRLTINIASNRRAFGPPTGTTTPAARTETGPRIHSGEPPTSGTLHPRSARYHHGDTPAGRRRHVAERALTTKVYGYAPECVKAHWAATELHRRCNHAAHKISTTDRDRVAIGPSWLAGKGP